MFYTIENHILNFKQPSQSADGIMDGTSHAFLTRAFNQFLLRHSPVSFWISTLDIHSISAFIIIYYN
jgi:hypothetical protein